MKLADTQIPGSVTFLLTSEETVWLELIARMGLVMDPALHFDFSNADILRFHRIACDLRLSHEGRNGIVELTLPYREATLFLVYLSPIPSAYSPQKLCPQIAHDFPDKETLRSFTQDLDSLNADFPNGLSGGTQ